MWFPYYSGCVLVAATVPAVHSIHAKEFIDDLGLWDVSACRSMASMFWCAAVLKGDVSDWDVSACKSMESMFAYATAFNNDVSGWDVSACKNMEEMFKWAEAFNSDVSA